MDKDAGIPLIPPCLRSALDAYLGSTLRLPQRKDLALRCYIKGTRIEGRLTMSPSRSRSDEALHKALATEALAEALVAAVTVELNEAGTEAPNEALAEA